jgi:hypothetical protein
MIESAITLLDKFSPELLVILGGLLVITATLFLWIWFANRRAYHLLQHQLPASVVKTYLDSIIQNSHALKSSLLRGGGAEVDVNAIPSVLPLGSLGGAGTASLGGGAREAELSALVEKKNAEVETLKKQLEESKKATAANSGPDLKPELEKAKARIKELEALLAAGNQAGDAGELNKVKKERDELKEKLKEYEIIEDDLANLKRLQQENAQLKKSLEASGGAVPAAPAAAAAPAKTPSKQDSIDELFDQASPANSVADAPVTETPTAVAEASVATEAAPVEAAAKTDQKEKTPEDLLSEFEKMLG